ncbi:glycosyltransferase family 2 protein [Croceiramulus getboli]|nr:glycosyltransferase [Flavobacteriaceae bacterium YJPT1-3]
MFEPYRSILEALFLGYGIALFSCYFCFAILAIFAVRSNKRKSQFLKISDIQKSQDLPGITLIAPAYNEAKSIVVNVRSLLSIQYPYYDLIIVNDGSTDDSLDQLKKAYDLVERPMPQGDSRINTQIAKTYYRSTNAKYQHLTVIDKVNGGRADALNCGIKYAQSELVLCTDADCIIEQDALLKMVRPFLEETKAEVVACGAAIGIANDSVIRNGVLSELRMPKSWVARIQVVEYIRAFLLGRMAWSQMDGLLLVSGAFGMYPRKRVVEVGGFDHNTVGEDLELCIRLRSYMTENDMPYDVVYLPETLCWTEAPATPKVYATQRDRWARGLWETIKKHRRLFLNYKYKQMGLFFFPYWVFFELWAPIVEFLGFVLILIYLLLGLVNLPFALYLFLLVYLVGCIFSTFSIMLYTINFKHYAKPKMIIQLLLAAYVESFYTHPVMLYAEMRGYFKKVFRIKSGWGNMVRKGFVSN